MVLSKACSYAIRALIYAARQDTDLVPIRKIADDLGLSFHFLTKIFQTLSNNDITVSCKGAKGGIKLNYPLDNISLADIVIAVDGRGLFEDCLLGLAHCSQNPACEIHGKWSQFRAELSEFFETTTLDKLAHKSPPYQLAL
ncbi:MAG: Rrf2 family transcriptional regulator [Chitinivibrionales bacterium]|nr:Rrf2 family transcriptional regulator [Chitinivibrionales bacterium]